MPGITFSAGIHNTHAEREDRHQHDGATERGVGPPVDDRRGQRGGAEHGDQCDRHTRVRDRAHQRVDRRGPGQAREGRGGQAQQQQWRDEQHDDEALGGGDRDRDRGREVADGPRDDDGQGHQRAERQVALARGRTARRWATPAAARTRNSTTCQWKGSNLVTRLR